MIRCLRVRNFKVFEEFGVENLRSINLITGKNNVGKTTLLEAIWAFIGRSNPQTFNQISLFHGGLPVYTPFISQPLPIVEIHWAPNFTNFDLSRQIEVSVVRDDAVFDTKRHPVQNGSARNEGKGVGLEGKGVGLEGKGVGLEGKGVGLEGEGRRP